ncbi:hypothetical protein BDF14DRAFT_1879649 [Spinellus fusiger]|nr:hypothetical protein BDF14DRAFT_1879649 [Spinellus fusiger]
MTSLPANAYRVCDGSECISIYKVLDPCIHVSIDGPDPRDHFANERNLLTWLRTGMSMGLLGFITFYDGSSQLPYRRYLQQTPASLKSSLWLNSLTYLFLGLGLASIGIATGNYFYNQRRLLLRRLDVGRCRAEYGLVGLMTVFSSGIMVAILIEQAR